MGSISTTELENNKYFEKQLDKLVRYCESEEVGFKVEFKSGSDYADNISKIIRVSPSYEPEEKVYTLLHEMGHIALMHPEKGYYELYPAALKTKEVTVLDRVSRVEEELDAWKAGRKIANKLRVRINQEHWNEIKAKCIFGYFKWAVNPKKFSY